MFYDSPLQAALFLKRYKRFLVDVRFPNGEEMTVHCPNTGSMATCLFEQGRVLLSHSKYPKRKYAYTLELTNSGKSWILVNTHKTNHLAKEAILNGTIKELSGYDELLTEQAYGEKSRIDILLKGKEGLCYVEVKNVTLLGSDGHYQFPDAVTTRGQKHLKELTSMVKKGHRAVMLYVIGRKDGENFRVAHEIDSTYNQLLMKAHKQGVEVLCYQTECSATELTITSPVTWIPNTVEAI